MASVSGKAAPSPSLSLHRTSRADFGSILHLPDVEMVHGSLLTSSCVMAVVAAHALPIAATEACAAAG
jgi:hypothetical protein